MFYVLDIETDTIVHRSCSRNKSNTDNNGPQQTIEGMRMTVAVGMTPRGHRHDYVLHPGATADQHAAEMARLGAALDDALMLVIYNGRNFDLRVLRAYFDVERVRGWERKLADPFEAILRSPPGVSSWVKLDEILVANGLAPKSANGAEAVEWWANGEVDRVLEYCAHDTHQLWELTRLGMSQPLRFPVKQWVQVQVQVQQEQEQEQEKDKDKEKKKEEEQEEEPMKKKQMQMQMQKREYCVVGWRRLDFVRYMRKVAKKCNVDWDTHWHMGSGRGDDVLMDGGTELAH